MPAASFFAQIKNLRFKTAGFVGLSEFESETSCPPDKHANQLRYSPLCFEIIAHSKKSCKCLAAFCAENNFKMAVFSNSKECYGVVTPPHTLSWFINAKWR